MEINKVVFNNFRPYYGNNEINLSVNPEQNVVLVGGRNGQGKTSFLVGLVWGIYGNLISGIDNVFRKEIRHNYPRFLMESLNRAALEQNIQKFSITVEFDNVELSETFKSNDQKKSKVTLIRSYDLQKAVEDFDILIDGEQNQLIADSETKMSFVNDYLIPLEAAKFIFFDAEKISEIADLGLKEQGRIMDDAFGKILGLSKYKDLCNDLENYIKDLKKRKEENTLVAHQIEANENKISLNNKNLEKLTIEEEEVEVEIDKLCKEIFEYESFLARKGAKGLSINIDDIDRQKIDAENELKILGNRLHEIAELIPFAIMSGKIQELYSQLTLEKEINEKLGIKKELEKKRQVFIDALFDAPPFPDEDMKIKSKAFYYEKSEKLFNELYLGEYDVEDITITHGLGRNSIEYINQIYTRLQNGNDSYHQIFSDHIRVQNSLNELSSKLNKAKAGAENEDMLEYKDKLQNAQYTRDIQLKKKGELENRIILLKEDTNKVEEQLRKILDKVEVSKQEQDIIDDVNKHINTLTQFIEQQKSKKCESLKSTLFLELKRLMHKEDLFDDINVNILPNHEGLEVSLIKNGKDVPKEPLSSGEKQIYISCLLKAILKEAIVEYPIFIDTPLGRLDTLHKDNFVNEYYPFLSNQVVLLTTDEEVTLKRKEKIEHKIANSYLLVNHNNQTTIEEGYF